MAANDRDVKGELDPDRTRVRVGPPAAAQARPARPVSLEDMSLNMATSIAPATPAAAAPVAPPAARSEPEPGSNLAVTLSALSAILLAVALAVVVVVGQRRIQALSSDLAGNREALAQEKTKREAAEQRIGELKGELDRVGSDLKEREKSLDKTQRQAERLRETGEKTKTQLQRQLEDGEDKLLATEKELAETRLEAQRQKEASDATISELQASSDALGQAKSKLEKDLASERRQASELNAENRKLRDQQSREAAAVKKLLVELTQTREEAAAERSRRKALEEQLRRNGLTPETAPPRNPPRIQEEDPGEVEERDIR